MNICSKFVSGVVLTVEGSSLSACVPSWGCACGDVLSRISGNLCAGQRGPAYCGGAMGGPCVHGIMVVVGKGRQPFLQSRPSPPGL